MKSLISLLATAFLILASASPIYAQASSTTAELRGQVTDPAGAVVPGARLTLTDVNKGITRSATADDEGHYIFLNLLPSIYELRVEASGFAPSSTRIELSVGQQANIPVRLGAGQLEVSVEVVGGAEVVETARTQQSSVIDERQITNLPISRRNYLDYALLTPGVIDSDNIADASDYRVAQTPQSGLSFGGSNGRGNYVSVDGGATLTGSGGVVAVVSQEAVQEFQVLRNSFNAEFGTSNGGVINTVSKSGSNRLHGSLFGLFRDDVFDARNAFDFSPDGQSPFNRQQYGGSIGGPIVRDRTFYFVALERFDQEETTFVNLLNDPNVFQPTASQTQLFTGLAGTPFAALATALRGALTTNATLYPRTIKLFTDATGQFPFDSFQTMLTGRLDHNFSDRSTGYLRYNLNDSSFENQAAGALTAVSRGRRLDTFNQGVLLSHNYQFSPRVFNEAKFQHIYLRFGVDPNDELGPELNIEGFGNFGRDIFLPSRTFERHWDVYDNLSVVAGDHTFKFGGSLLFLRISTNNQTFGGGRFNFGTAIPLSNIIAANAGTATLQQLTAYLQANSPALIANLNAPINALQSFNFNLPIVYQQGFGDPVEKSWTNRYSLYAQDTWKVRPNFTFNYGLRYSISDEPLQVPTDYKGWQPRAGFSWDPWSDGKTAIRGGAGIFTGYVNHAVPNVVQELGANGDPTEIQIIIATPNTGPFGLPTSFAVYQTLLARGVLGNRAITLEDVAGPPLNIRPRPGGPLEVRFRLADDYRSPTTYQASFGVQRDLGGGFSLDTSYLFTRGLYLTRNRDINQFKISGPPNPLNPLGGPTFVRFPAAGQTSDFRNPLRFQDNLYESSASSFYHALTLQLQKRFADNFSLNAHYTLSKAIDEVTDFNSDFSAQNPLNLRLDRAVSAFDQRHRAVISGVFASPIKGDSIARRIVADWIFSPIFIAASGRPFNLLLGFDANGDGRSQSDRPGVAGRNTGLGEPFYSFDMRLARRFLAREARYLEFTFEAFNLFNRTNLLGINNTVGTTYALVTDYNARGDRSRAPTQPLGFTSAANARQLQFGVRFNF